MDDEPVNLALLREVLGRAGEVELTTTTSSLEAVELVGASDPHLVLLDLHMPGLSGLDVLERLYEASPDGAPPVLMLTGDTTLEARQRALSLGARDFVTKPFDVLEIELRVRNLLQARRYELSLASRGRARGCRAGAHGGARGGAAGGARAVGAGRRVPRRPHRRPHPARRAHGAAAGGEVRDAGAEVTLLELAAPLHDVGKIAVPDPVLLKPGRLTAAELEVVRAHVTVGARILGGSASPLLRMAEVIALRHHERWDGGGYPDGLAGDAISPAARIVAVADVFDALLCARPYKPPWPLARAVEEVLAGASRQFCPQTVAAFAELPHVDLVPSGAQSARFRNRSA